jgi:hypothetical protein
LPSFRHREWRQGASEPLNRWGLTGHSETSVTPDKSDNRKLTHCGQNRDDLVRTNKQPTSALAQTTPHRAFPTRRPTSWTLGPIFFPGGALDVSHATGNPAQPVSGGGDVVSGCTALGARRDWLSDLLHAVVKGILPRPLFRWLALILFDFAGHPERV